MDRSHPTTTSMSYQGSFPSSGRLNAEKLRNVIRSNSVT